MRVGLDFGTTYSKISFLDPGTNRLQLFSYPGESGRPYVPTTVTYYQGILGKPEYEIGEASRDRVGEEGIDFCQGFKLMLPLADRALWQQYGWRSERSPDQVTADYLKRLLIDDRQSFQKMHGPISSIVMSVPQLWHNGSQNHGASLLEEIAARLSLPLDHLRSEPACAAVFYAAKYPELEGREFEGILLLCDVGGGTFDVTVCRIAGRKSIRVIDFGGSGESGVGQAGVAFDREAVRRAYVRRHAADGVLRAPELCDYSGKALDPYSPELLERLLQRHDFVKLLREFEWKKINLHNRIEENLLAYGNSPLLADSTAYDMGNGYKVTFDDIKQAFAPIGQSISRVLKEISGRLQQQQVDLTTIRLAIVGSFGQFPYTRRAILDQLGIAENGDKRYDARLNSHNMAYAVSYGATLIANGVGGLEEPYPHTVGIRLYTVRDGLLTRVFYPVVSAGQQVGGKAAPIFMLDDAGKPDVVEVVAEADGKLPIEIIVRGEGEPVPIMVPVAQFPPPGKYHVGLSLNRSNLARLVFRSADGSSRDRQYDLGDLDIKIVRR